MKLGVIGGLGPMASAYFISRVTEMTDVEKDQDHIEILLHSCPEIPDRTSYILNKSEESPLPKMIEVGQGLAKNGAGIIAVPCVTAQYFEKELNQNISVPVIDTIAVTAEYLSKRGFNKVGLMATDGTVTCGLFQRKLKEAGIDCIVPDEDNQQAVMDIIYQDVKKGNPINYDHFNRVIRSLKINGAQVIILGCTELSIVKRDFNMPPGILDVIDVLSQTVVLKCGRLKKEFYELIT